MTVKHGCTQPCFSLPRRLFFPLRCHRSGVIVYYFSLTRKKPQEWAVGERHDEKFSFVLLIVEGSGLLGDNSMRWIVWWYCLPGKRLGDAEGGAGEGPAKSHLPSGCFSPSFLYYHCTYLHTLLWSPLFCSPRTTVSILWRKNMTFPNQRTLSA